LRHSVAGSATQHAIFTAPKVNIAYAKTPSCQQWRVYIGCVQC